MTIAAITCNPAESSAVRQYPLGTIGYGPGNALFVYVQANGAVTRHRIVSIQAGFQAIVRDSADIVHGTTLGASPDTGVSNVTDNHYFWAQIYGEAFVAGGDSVSAGAALQLDASDTGRVIAATTDTPECLGMHANEALSNGVDGRIQLNFPVNRE